MTETKRLTVEELDDIRRSLLTTRAMFNDIDEDHEGEFQEQLDAVFALAREGIEAREIVEFLKELVEEGGDGSWKAKRLLAKMTSEPVAAPPPEDQPDKIAELCERLESHEGYECPYDLLAEAATALQQQSGLIKFKKDEISATNDVCRELIAERDEAQAEIARLREAAEIAYSEMCFAVHDLAGRRLNSENAIDTRSKKLALAADKLHAALGGKE